MPSFRLTYFRPFPYGPLSNYRQQNFLCSWVQKIVLHTELIFFIPFSTTSLIPGPVFVALIPGPVFVTSRFLVTSRYLYSTISTGVLSFGSCSDHRTLFCPLRWIFSVCNSPWQPARLLRPVSASENLQAAMSPRDRCKRVKSPERNKESARLCSSVRNRTFHSALTKCT